MCTCFPRRSVAVCDVRGDHGLEYGWRAHAFAVARASATGALLGPTIYTASHTVDGYPPLNEMFVTAERADEAATVRESKQAGYDFIKVYGTLRPDVFRAILESGTREKIPVVGHTNRQLGALEVEEQASAGSAPGGPDVRAF